MTRTCRPTRCDRRGFSLIELLVVIGLIAMITMVALPSVNSYFKLSLTSAARELATTTREAYNSAILTGRVHRVVYDLKNQQYWVEKGPATLLLDTAETKDREEHRKRFVKGSEKPVASGFEVDKSINRGKATLPRGVEFKDVLSEKTEEPITTGTAYTHIFPHGIAEQTVVHLQDDNKHTSSLIVNSIAGKTKVVDRYLDRREALGEK